MLERRLLGNVPWGMVALIIGIATIGLTAVYSATYTSHGPSSLFTKQIIWICLGIIVMFAALIPDYHTVGRYAYVLYAVSVVFLILVAIAGKTGMGAQRCQPWHRSKGVHSKKAEAGAVIIYALEQMGRVQVERGPNWRRVFLVQERLFLEPRPRSGQSLGR